MHTHNCKPPCAPPACTCIYMCIYTYKHTRAFTNIYMYYIIYLASIWKLKLLFTSRSTNSELKIPFSILYVTYGLQIKIHSSLMSGKAGENQWAHSCTPESEQRVLTLWGARQAVITIWLTDIQNILETVELNQVSEPNNFFT